MNKTKGQLLADVIESIRAKQVCGYANNKHKCDCKYGGDHIGSRSEHNGCPELRDAVKILSNLSNKQYDHLLGKKKSRANPEMKKLEKKMEKLNQERIKIEQSMFDMEKAYSIR